MPRPPASAGLRKFQRDVLSQQWAQHGVERNVACGAAAIQRGTEQNGLARQVAELLSDRAEHDSATEAVSDQVQRLRAANFTHREICQFCRYLRNVATHARVGEYV